jgi:SAM-dependent methyltransferase
MSTPIEQHNLEIRANRKGWERKPALREVYSGFYREISAQLRSDIQGKIVELGSGLGNAKSFIPECITTDIFPNPWIDQVEDAYRLSFGNQSVSNLILFDVWHHLQYPGTALNEFRRVLAPGGRVIIFEPAMGLVGRVVLGLFHHEPLGLGKPIEWIAPAEVSPETFPYYAAQGNASRIFGRAEYKEQLAGWSIVEQRYFSGIAYVATGGFSGPQLLPTPCFKALGAIDSVLSRLRWLLPEKLASRMLVVLEAAC